MLSLPAMRNSSSNKTCLSFEFVSIFNSNSRSHKARSFGKVANNYAGGSLQAFLCKQCTSDERTLGYKTSTVEYCLCTLG